MVIRQEVISSFTLLFHAIVADFFTVRAVLWNLGRLIDATIVCSCVSVI